MYYVISRGPITPFWQKAGLTAGVILPAVITAVVILSLFSYNSSTGAGRNPRLSLPPRSATAANVGVSSAPAQNVGSNNDSAPVKTGGSSQPAAPSGLTTGTISGGRGGGGSSSPTSTPTNLGTTTSTTTSTTTANSSGLLPQSVTVPSTNLQAGGKTIISTSPTTLTLN